MDTTTIVRIVAGILAVAVLAFVIYRRKHAKVYRLTVTGLRHHDW